MKLPSDCACVALLSYVRIGLLYGRTSFVHVLGYYPTTTIVDPSHDVK